MATKNPSSDAFATQLPTFTSVRKLLSKVKNFINSLFSHNNAPKCLDSYLEQAEKLKLKVAQDQMNAKMVSYNTFTKF